MKTLADMIIQPLLSEKSSAREAKFNEFTVVIDDKMTKTDVIKAVEKLTGVKPLGVRTVVFRKKTKKNNHGIIPARSFKKALIRMPEGKRFEIK